MINITDAELFSIDHQYDLLGDAFNYRNIQNISVRGRILSTAQDGVLDIWQSSSGYIFDDWQNITINGVNLGQGRITNTEFDVGLHVRQLPYTINIELLKTGNLYNLTGAHYSGINFNTGELIYVDGLSESFSFERGEDGIYSYQRDLNFGVAKTLTNDTVSIAKNLVDDLFNDDPLTQLVQAQYPSFHSSSGIRYSSESYDLENHEYSFSETFDFLPGQNYTWVYSHSLDIGEDGIATISENGTIQGTASGAYAAASGAFSSLSGNIYNRISGMLAGYSGILNATSCDLSSTPRTRSVSADTCAGFIEYTYEFSNDPRSTNSGYLWEYSQSFTRNENGIYSAVEEGTVIGQANTRSQAFDNAISGYNNEIVAGIKPRLTGAITGIANLSIGGFCSGATSLVKESSTLEYSEFEGRIGYTHTYSSSDYLVTGDPNFLSIIVTSGNSTPVHGVNTFGIMNYKEIAQSVRNNILGNFIWNVVMQGKNGTQLQTYLDKAFTLVKKPTSIEGKSLITSDTHINNFSYDFNPIENTFNMQLGYAVNRYRSFSDNSIW